jgi:glycosyltransferase involved in cell wall biosynthesis
MSENHGQLDIAKNIIAQFLPVPTFWYAPDLDSVGMSCQFAALFPTKKLLCGMDETMSSSGQDFTVVIPLYNRAGLIPETLTSVLHQTLPPESVIVVDDGSTDNSPDIVAKFGSRVTLVRNGKQGVQAARNAGIALARTSWVVLCDSDDLWEPTWLERIATLRRVAPEVDFVFGNFRILRDGVLSVASKFDDAPPGYWDKAAPIRMAEGWVFRESIAGQSFLWHPMFPSAMAFSKNLVARTGGFDSSFKDRISEDGEFTLRLLYHARTGAIPEPLVQIRKHGNNVSGDQLKLLIDEIWSLDFAKRNHDQARPYHDVIDQEIVRRTIQAANLAFAAKDHALVCRLVKDVPRARRPAKLRMKHLVASLPAPIALPANTLLQRLSELK